MGINKKRIKPLHTESMHLNWMGGESYDIKNPIARLRMAASSCFFGEPMYYHRDRDDRVEPRLRTRSRLSDVELRTLRDTLDAVDPQEWRGLTPTQLMEKAIDEALEHDAEATLELAAELRNVHYIRTTPQVILVRAANTKSLKGSGLIRKHAPRIIKRADEPAVCMAYQISAYGRKSIPNSLKKALGDALAKFNEYQLGKYRMESRNVKTVDVVNLVHPPATKAISALVNGTLTVKGKTWESIISDGGSWNDAIKVMGHMALLRNLRNFHQKSVDPNLYLDKLISGVQDGKQLPFRYYSAYKACKGAYCKPQVLDAIEECLELSLANTPHFNGVTISLCDNSGSATGTCTSNMGTMRIASIANLTGVITGKVSDEGYVGVFGDRLDIIPVRKRDSVFTLTQRCDRAGMNIGGGTENGIWIFWRDAIKNKTHYDNIFVYSDMQAGHGGLYGIDPNEYRLYRWSDYHHIDVAKLVKTYRAEVNKDVNVYLVQVAGYQDTIIPEFYKKTYILGGWGDGILKFAHAMSGGYAIARQ
jgi:hypothetical protein